VALLTPVRHRELDPTSSTASPDLVDPTRLARRRRPSTRVPRSLQRLAGPLLAVVAWQLLTTWEIVDTRTIPSPGSVLTSARELLASGELQSHLWVSLGRVAKGLGLGLVVGTVLAVVAGLSRLGENLIDANMEVVRAIPNFSLVPVLIVWFGLGEQPKVILISLTVAVAIYINTYSAIRNVDAGLVEAARSFGVGNGELIRRVILPGSLPGFLVGLRLAMTGSWLALIFAETINARQGLGRMMTDAREYFQLDVIFVLIAVYATLGLASHALVRFLEGRLLTWRRATNWPGETSRSKSASTT
jgi:sulfonate transport system permease protein